MREKDAINSFLVTTFNHILKSEEKSLNKGKFRLSVKEFHLIEAIKNASYYGNSTPSEIARILGITRGTVTTSVNTLVKKGYVTRDKRDADARRVMLDLSEIGEKAYEFHKNFHENMMRGVYKQLDKDQTVILAQALETLNDFFKKEGTF